MNSYLLNNINLNHLKSISYDLKGADMCLLNFVITTDFLQNFVIPAAFFLQQDPNHQGFPV